jgi:hypothetical protein
MTFIILTVLAILIGAVGFYFLSQYVLIKQPPMVLNIIKVVLLAAVVLVAILNYNSIQDKIELEKEIAHRNVVVIEHMEHIKDAQVAFKKEKGYYARDFRQLTNFLENDSLIMVKAIGEVPDSLLGQEAKALELGIIIRDTSLIPVRTQIWVGEDFNKIVADMPNIPFSDGKQFSIEAGEIEKNNQKIKVFKVEASYKDIFNGMDVKNEGVDLDKFMTLGSMTEPTTNGNWSK